jgi:hypothetical protein
LFYCHGIRSCGIKVQTPIIVKVDNIGAIIMTENVSATSHTKHIDTRYHFVREFVEDDMINIVLVKTQDNKADMFTKNVSGEVYDEHVESFIMDHKDITPHAEQHGRVLECTGQLVLCMMSYTCVCATN